MRNKVGCTIAMNIISIVTDKLFVWLTIINLVCYDQRNKNILFLFLNYFS